METPDDVVDLRDITKSYRVGFRHARREAVSGLSLSVGPGQIFGLLGPNGAGKTTTLKVMLGLAFPDAGEGTVLGRPLGDREAHMRLGFLPESPYFYGFLTAEKALQLYGRLFGLDAEVLSERSARLLDLVGIPRESHLTLDKYSKGMLQRIGIAQALINDPELVIMDEPSSGLDPLGQKEIRDVLLGLREDGKTILLSSHQLSEVESICDSVSIIDSGRVVIEGSLSELLTEPGTTRITLRGGGEAAGAALAPLATNVRRDEGEIIMDVAADDAYRALEKASELGLGLVSVEPARRSLEDLFLEAVRGDGP
ncbi:MAG: ABC transporter ATP-binding protein [Actinobacteria bacterium]|nr:ABC transporter ATP-binding protein [Actinomycetota bacterium]MBU1942140.1 ABC transporter ATP-binding protein [Actinomycetota bacterium]MBU2686676.1 ABC transporter ATP-binding protein [Actinomycetota bacterium]